MEGGRTASLIGTLKHAAQSALELLLPAVCPACDHLLDAGDTGLICGRCWVRVSGLQSPQCTRCGHPGVRQPCSWCELLPAFVSAARSVCWMHTGTGTQIVHALKYGRWHGVARSIGGRMARINWRPGPGAVLVPVPLAPEKERDRGFNQSERIATALGLAWRIPTRVDALERVRATQTQTRLTPEERLANVSGAFRARHTAFSAGANVVLVDDVVTTAATLNACATELVAAGARSVSYLTFGRAPAPADRQ